MTVRAAARRGALAAVLAATTLAATGCYSSPDNGKIGVVRGDGPIEGHSGIKGIICPGDKRFVFNDEVHQYPDATSQRTFKFNDDEDADTGPITGLRTRDGYKVTLRGTIFFKTAFDCSPTGRRLLREFDRANASRPEGQRPWEDLPGYLLNQWKPILDRTARNAILGFNVRQVISSAALLQNARNADDVAAGVNNQASQQQIENALATGLRDQLRAKLGDDYFRDITFNMEAPTLPDVDDAIATAQKALARVAEVRAERLRQQEQVQVEIQKRKAASQRARGYARCSSCARQDELRALGNSLPAGVTTLVFGSGSGVTIGNGGRR
jgi:hypothetical protein